MEVDIEVNEQDCHDQYHYPYRPSDAFYSLWPFEMRHIIFIICFLVMMMVMVMMVVVMFG
ncbi:MAG: hypothetical protein Q4E26_02420 [Prevotellaceae bacterium]|nr:hypothetical protein [Prevotellaceae bacterium]